MNTNKTTMTLDEFRASVDSLLVSAFGAGIDAAPAHATQYVNGYWSDQALPPRSWDGRAADAADDVAVGAEWVSDGETIYHATMHTGLHTEN